MQDCEHTRCSCIFLVNPLHVSVAALDWISLEQGLYRVTPFAQTIRQNASRQRHVLHDGLFQGQHVNTCMT